MLLTKLFCSLFSPFLAVALLYYSIRKTSGYVISGLQLFCTATSSKLGSYATAGNYKGTHAIINFAISPDHVLPSLVMSCSTMQNKAMNTILIMFRDCRVVYAYYQTTLKKSS